MNAAKLAPVGERRGSAIRTAGGIFLPLHMRKLNGARVESRAGMGENEPRAHGPRRIAQAEYGKFEVWHVRKFFLRVTETLAGFRNEIAPKRLNRLQLRLDNILHRYKNQERSQMSAAVTLSIL